MARPTSGDEYRQYLQLVLPSLVAALDSRKYSSLQPFDMYTLAGTLVELRVEKGLTRFTLNDLAAECSWSLTDEQVHTRLATLEAIGLLQRDTHGPEYEYRIRQPFGWTRYPTLFGDTNGALIEPQHIVTPRPTRSTKCEVTNTAVDESDPIDVGAYTASEREYSETQSRLRIRPTLTRPKSAVQTETPTAKESTQYARVSDTASTAAMASSVGGLSLVFGPTPAVVPTLLWLVMGACLSLWAVTDGVDRLAQRWGDPAGWLLDAPPTEY